MYGRSVGDLRRGVLERLRRRRERARAVLAVLVHGARRRRRAAPDWLFVRSIRSLSGPGALRSALRSLNVGRASCASGRSSARNGRSFLATGLESSTSGLRSSSVARRLRNVVLARRRNGGSCSTESASACWREPIALVVVARWSTRPARSSLRSARSVTSLRGGDDEALEQRRVGVELAEQPRGRRERRVEVQQAGVELVAAAAVAGWRSPGSRPGGPCASWDRAC